MAITCVGDHRFPSPLSSAASLGMMQPQSPQVGPSIMIVDLVAIAGSSKTVVKR